MALGDLLAQAEHDDDALPILVTPSAELADRVEAFAAVQPLGGDAGQARLQPAKKVRIEGPAAAHD